jgi:alpha-N-arabinofuranosidase
LPWDANAGNRYETHVGNAANSYQSIELLGEPGAAVGLMQRLYLPVHRTRRYTANVYARRLAGSGELTFALRNQSGRELAHANTSVERGTWTKLSASLELPKDSLPPREKVDFGVYTVGTGRIEIDQLTLTPADAVDGFDPDVLALAKQMGMTELRFGGNFSSFYHWREGIGNPSARKTVINVGWGIPEYNNFGTDEFLQLCRDLNVIPQININMGSGTVKEAADWVRYIRKRYQGPVIWELGNELWGPWQVGPPTIQQLPARTLAFSKAVRAASPEDEIIATGGTPTGFADWNAAELGLPRGTFDDLSLHFVETSGRDERWKPRTIASTYMVYAKSYHVGESFGTLQQQVDSSAHRNHVHFAMTEWLFNSMAEGEGNFTSDFPAWNNLGGAVAAAGFLNTLLRHTAEIRIADMTGMIEFAGIAKHREVVYAQPAFYVFQMYSGIKGQQFLQIQTDRTS